MSYFPAISQNIIVDTANSEAGAVIVPYVNPADIWNYNGVGTSTLGVNAIQIVVTSDKNLIIYVDQGNANNSFQITDTYNYLTTKQFGITIQAVGAYVRVRAKNTATTGDATATIDTVECPIVEALPRSLDASGNLKVAIQSNEDGYGFEAENTPQGELRAIAPIRLAGVSFEGNTLDTNFWRTILLNGATVTQQNGRLDIQTLTTANGSASLYTSRKARYVTGSANQFRMQGRFGDTGTANNVRRFGAGVGANFTLTISSAAVVAGDVYTDISGVQYTIMITGTVTTANVFATGTPTAGARTYTRVSGTGTASLTGSAFAVANTITDGYYFQLGGAGGAIFSVVTAIGGTPSAVDSGSFNGDLGATYEPNVEMQTWEIYYNTKTVWFVINGTILHSVSNVLTPLSNTQTLHAFMSNTNSGGSTSNVGLYSRSLSIRRLGLLETEKTFLYSNTNSTKILKYGAGRLYRVIFGNPELAQIVTLYDGMSTAAPLIATLTNIASGNQHGKVPTSIEFNCPFNNGLIMVTSTTEPVTVIYE